MTYTYIPRHHDPEQNHQPRHWIWRVLSESRLLLALLLIIASAAMLLSYAPTDAAYSTTGTGAATQNWLGAPGAWLADIVYLLFGRSIWLLWALAVWSWLRATLRWVQDKRKITPEPVAERTNGSILQMLVHYAQRAIRPIGAILMLMSACALEWARAYHWDALLPNRAGGLLGYSLGALGERLLGFNVLTLLAVAVFVLAFSWAFAFSWNKLAIHVGATIERVFFGYKQKREYQEDVRIGEQALRERETASFAKQEEYVASVLPPVLVEAPAPKVVQSQRVAQERQHTLFVDSSSSKLPQVDLLDPVSVQAQTVTPETLEMTSRLIEKKLKDFGVEVRVVLASPGPVITRYEIEPATGVKGSQIMNLSKDLARSLSLISVRVIETIPGKNYMALELPNAKRQSIGLAEILGSTIYNDAKSMLTMGLGKDIVGNPVVADLAKMPHCLVAGTTGSGKSVGINAMILSLLYKAEAKDVRLLLIDPKMLEMSVYEGIPHLLAPVVTDMRQAAHGLNWCVAEMEKRYKLMSKMGVRNLAGYNQKIDEAKERGEYLGNPFSLTPEQPEPLERLPYIVVVIDELADLMMVVGKKIEELIARLAQKARAAGIHLILATQRPSVDVITGLIKANIPTRISFQVSSKIDSRTILDQMGAEALLGMGDMLYMPSGTGFPIRVHGAFVSDEEVHRVVAYLKSQGEAQYIEGVLEGGVADDGSALSLDGDSAGDKDPMYDQAVAVVLKNRKASISLVQRHLKIGYNRAANMLEEMEKSGLVSSMSGSGQREILVPAGNAD